MRLEKPGISSRFLPAFAIFAEDRRQFGNLCVQARTIALTFHDLCLQYFESQRRHDGIQKTDTGRNRGAHGRRKQRGKLGCHRSRTRLHPGPTFGLSARRTRTDRAGSTAAPLHHTQLPHRRRGADRRGYGARMPPRILVRQRSPGRRHQRERRTYRTDLRPTHRPDRLHPGRLSLSPRGCRSHRTNDRTLRHRAPRHPRYRWSARTHHRRPFHPGGQYRGRSDDRRSIPVGKRHGLRRSLCRHRRPGPRFHRRRRSPHRRRHASRTLLRRRMLHAGQTLHGRRFALFRQQPLRKRRGRFDLRGSLHRFAPQILAADRRNVLVLQRRQRRQPEQPPLQERRSAPVRPPAGMQIRQQLRPSKDPLRWSWAAIRSITTPRRFRSPTWWNRTDVRH